MINEVILVIGANGQIGSELTNAIKKKYPEYTIIASDIRKPNTALFEESIIFEILDATKFDDVKEMIVKYKVSQVYLMAAMLSATAEANPMKAWSLNMDSLFHVLNLAKDKYISKVFWPSSIAVFGPNTPKNDTPQNTIMNPSTVYGISKVSGEYWCEYYKDNYNVDVRSIRYPGIISWKTMPGGGTTDYAIDIFHAAIKNNLYTCFLESDTMLPMMYMEDAINATLQLMNAPQSNLTQTAYNISGLHFTPEELFNTIKNTVKDFSIIYNPDFRQAIADTWPNSIKDTFAQKDWQWHSKFNLEQITIEMLQGVKKYYESDVVSS